MKGERSEAGAETAPRSPSAEAAVAWAVALFFLALALGCILAPSVFWDGFVWPYLWGPTEADALDRPIDSVTENYNAVSTLTYGALLAAALFLIFRAFQRRKVDVSPAYIRSLIPFVLFGTLSRALEDSLYFSRPVAYLFIAPQIYALVGAVVVCASVWHRWLTAERRRVALLVWLLVPVHILLLVCGFSGPLLSTPPALAALATLLAAAGLTLWVLGRRSATLSLPTVLSVAGTQSLAGPLALALLWLASPGAWGGGAAPSTHIAELAVVPLLAITAALALWLVLHMLSLRQPRLAPMASGTSAAIILGHMLDAAATYRALDYFTYGEKHVLPSFLMEASGTGLVMFPLKAAALVLILYLLEVEFRRELEREGPLRGLVRAAVLILGLAPGIRDTVRVVMGV
ncbi:MAG: DUF63 family protein [Thermoplasmatota archaeon]